MHRVFHIQEILDHIFSHIDLQPSKPLTPGLRTPKSFIVALSITCKAFKEPALNILWEDLPDLIPLVRCLPEGSWVNSNSVYAFSRRLKQTDWDIILGYSRRVLSRSQSPLFPKLHKIWIWNDHRKNLEMSSFVQQLINPRLTDLYLETMGYLGNVLDTFGNCPNVKSFQSGEEVNHDTVSSLICHWENLRRVECCLAELNAAALAHLSSLYNLVHLSFKLHDELILGPSSRYGTFTMTFPTLQTLCLLSRYLACDRRFLRHLRLPVISNLSVNPGNIPTVPDLMSFLATLQDVCPRDTLHHFSLILGDDEFSEEIDYDPPYDIIFDHFHPLTVFVNIRSISIDIVCGVDLSERDLLSLTSSWPHLQAFSVLDYKHWTSSSYITPEGFILLLERCRSLRELNFKLDTRAYTEIPQGHPWRGLSMPQDAYLCFQSSLIEEEAIHALPVFFHVAPFPHFSLDTYWHNHGFIDSETPEELCDMYADRWRRVETLARRLWEERRDLKRELIARFSDTIL